MTHYSQITNFVLDELSSSISLVRNDRLSDAEDVLKKISNQLIYLKVIANSHADHAKKHGDYSQQQLEKIIEVVGGNNKEIKDLENDISKLNGDISEQLKTKHLNEKDVQRLQKDVRSLNSKIKSKQKEVDGWTVASFFGGIAGLLIVRAALSSLKDDLSSKRRELDRYEQELRKDSASLENIKKTFDESTSKLQKDKLDLKQLENAQRDMESRRKVFSRQVTFYSDIETFYGKALNAVSSLQNQNESTLTDIEVSLEDEVTVDIEEFVEAEVMSLKKGLKKFAEFLDKKYANEKQDKFIKLKGDDIGFYPYGYQLASSKDVKDNPDAALASLEEWDIARLQDGLGVKGPLYYQRVGKLEIEQYGPNELGDTLCIFKEDKDERIVGRKQFVLMETSTVTKFLVRDNLLITEVYNKPKDKTSPIWELNKKQIKVILDNPNEKIRVSKKSRFNNCGTVYIGDRIGLLFLHSKYPEEQLLREELIVVLLQADEYLQ